MILSHAVARETGYWVHVVADLNTISSSNMVKLGLCTADLDVTPLGYKCLERDMDISGTLLVEVGIRLGVGEYAKVAAAFLNSGVELFSNAHVGVKQVIPLTVEQLDVASKYGDVHTAVKWFLKWCPKQELPDHHEKLFNIICFRKMHTALYRKAGYFDIPHGASNYEIRLSVAIAFPNQKSIVCRHGNTCVTCHKVEDERRGSLALLNAEVKISERSVCYQEETHDSPSWLVYVATGRFPFIKAATVLPKNIAVWFSHFRFRQENEIEFARAFCCLLADPETSASLTEFVSLLHTIDDTDKGDATEEGAVTDVAAVGLDMPRDGAGDTNSNMAASSSTQPMSPSNIEEQRATRSYASASTGALASQAPVVTPLEASLVPRLPCSHELIWRVRDILRGDFEIDSSELVQVLRAIARASPHLRRDANSLVEAFMLEAAPSHVDTSRKDLVAILRFLLRGRLNAPNYHRKIKTFVYSLRLDMLKSFGDKDYLSLCDQEDLVRKALLSGSKGVVFSDDYDIDGAKRVIDSLFSHIAGVSVARGRSQLCREKAMKRVRKARQKVHMSSGKHIALFITHDEVLDMVMKDYSVTDKATAEKKAQRIWHKECFTLDIYRAADGTQHTRAEFLCEWLNLGYKLDESIAHLKTLTPTTSKRSLSPSYRNDAMKRARQNLEITYRPQVSAASADGGHGGRSQHYW